MRVCSDESAHFGGQAGGKNRLRLEQCQSRRGRRRPASATRALRRRAAPAAPQATTAGLESAQVESRDDQDVIPWGGCALLRDVGNIDEG